MENQHPNIQNGLQKNILLAIVKQRGKNISEV